MSKYPTYPILYDEVLQIHISKLKEWEYLKSGQVKSGVLNWSRNGNEIGSISIKADTQNSQPYIELDYTFRDEPRKYKVYLVSVPSNLGKGKLWYFLCPQTNKRCRKLYLVGGYFLHREAFKGCMYASQTRSKTWRGWEKSFGSYFDADECYDEIYSKHFKKYYRGKPTKRYAKLLRKIELSDCHSNIDVEKMILG